MPEDLRELIQLCLAGDQSAMLRLVDRFQGQVFGLCYRMLGHRQDAEDMTQETFIRVLKNLGRWDPARDFRPWLFAIAGNRCRTLLSTRMRKAAPVPLLEDNLPDDSHQEQQARHLQEEVNLALAELRPEWRQAFLLFHEQELSYIEIGQALDCPVGTVKTWVHRARKEIARVLQERSVIETRAERSEKKSSTPQD